MPTIARAGRCLAAVSVSCALLLAHRRHCPGRRQVHCLPNNSPRCSIAEAGRHRGARSGRCRDPVAALYFQGGQLLVVSANALRRRC